MGLEGHALLADDMYMAHHAPGEVAQLPETADAHRGLDPVGRHPPHIPKSDLVLGAQIEEPLDGGPLDLYPYIAPHIIDQP